ncbi:MAG: RagB/SusD family nutrient uptake outer membrane protein [Prevotellaceae bacterium]|nr:RagB/SusD family nutrient uptake outer membrane protein [Prevotellaceae bacterium]
MKNIKDNIKLFAAVAATTIGVSSCSLDLLPLNDVVLENYWTDKNDVESVVASCYQAMKEGSYISNMIVWGEGRSDNVAFGDLNSADLTSILQGTMKTTNAYCDWASMYNVINRCNTVLYYAPKVAGEDPNYTKSDLNITIAECSFMRAYSYLTLVKTFKNVPFSLEPSIDDSQDFQLPQTSFEDILDNLIVGIDSCKDFAPRKYSDAGYNNAKVTRAAMYALLAEMYLWRASDYNLSAEQKKQYYTRCVEACDWVLKFKREQYRSKDFNGLDIDDFDDNVWDIFGYPLLTEKSYMTGSNVSFPTAFTNNFGDCRSFESIFEIPFETRDGQSNDAVADMYGVIRTGQRRSFLKARQNIMTSIPVGGTTYINDNNTLFSTPTDFRSLLSFSWQAGDAFNITKYVVDMPMCQYSGSGNISQEAFGLTTSVRTTHNESWILYRLPEVMLFRAEAEIQLAALISENAEPTQWPVTDLTYRDGLGLVESASDLYADAYNLITAVYIRSNPATITNSKNFGSNAPKIAQFTNRAGFETYLMNERRREFLFEGKRFYDLVRQARREGNTEKFSDAMFNKYPMLTGALRLKLKQMDFMYMPVAKRQMQVNPNLVQNSAYADEEENVKN